MVLCTPHPELPKSGRTKDIDVLQPHDLTRYRSYYRICGKAFASQSPYGGQTPQLRVGKYSCLDTVVGTAGETISVWPVCDRLTAAAGVNGLQEGRLRTPRAEDAVVSCQVKEHGVLLDLAVL